MESKLNGTVPLATSAGLNIGRAVARAFAVTLVMAGMLSLAGIFIWAMKAFLLPENPVALII